MISISDGNYIILGETNARDSGWGLFSVKVDQNGDVLWEKFYNPEGTWHYAAYYGFELEDQGLVYLALVKRSGEDSLHSLRLFKAEVNGELLWSTHISTNTLHMAAPLLTIPSYNCVITIYFLQGRKQLYPIRVTPLYLLDC